MRTLSIAIAALACAAAAQGEAVKSLRLILPPEPGPVVEKIGRVFARYVEELSLCAGKRSPLTKPE